MARNNKQQLPFGTHCKQCAHPRPLTLRALPRKWFVPLVVGCGFTCVGGVEAPVAIVHHPDSKSQPSLVLCPAATAAGLTGGVL